MAELLVTDVAVVVDTVGVSAGVVKERMAPKAVPDAFCAMAQKKYVLPGSRPVVVSENDVAVVPLPTRVPPVAGTRVPKLSLQAPGFVVSRRNQPVVDSPPGLMEPFS
jgi:hypothetical protein